MKSFPTKNDRFVMNVSLDWSMGYDRIRTTAQGMGTTRK